MYKCAYNRCFPRTRTTCDHRNTVFSSSSDCIYLIFVKLITCESGKLTDTHLEVFFFEGTIYTSQTI